MPATGSPCLTSPAWVSPACRVNAQRQEVTLASKDKNAKKAMAKKPAQKTLKEKRQAKKDKK